MDATETLAAVLVALAVDAAIGDPARLWTRIPHPAAAAGFLIGRLERQWNKTDGPGPRRRAAGIALLLVIVAVAVTAGAALEWLIMRSLPAGYLAVGVVASVLIAQNGLYRHVARVRDALLDGGLFAGRQAVAHIVGRDPDRLDQSGVSRAAIESLAENFSDAVVAPAFWFALLGLPGLAAYKAVNTADSMIGHRSERYADFGWAAARLDDAANLIPARLTAAVVAAAAALSMGAASAKRAVTVALKDAAKHRSPNAGWPEAAFAGALDIALAGPRNYAHGRVDDVFVNDSGQKNLAPADISGALRLFAAAALVHGSSYAVLLAVFLV